MPTEDKERRFKRDVVEGSLLQYVHKMKYFYESQLDELSNMIGEKTVHGVTVTHKILEKIEERLSEFEEKERKIVDNCRQLLGEVEGVTF